MGYVVATSVTSEDKINLAEISEIYNVLVHPGHVQHTGDKPHRTWMPAHHIIRPRAR